MSLSSRALVTPEKKNLINKIGRDLSRIIYLSGKGAGSSKALEELLYKDMVL